MLHSSYYQREGEWVEVKGCLLLVKCLAKIYEESGFYYQSYLFKYKGEVKK
jgi:hypothetical protein